MLRRIGAVVVLLAACASGDDGGDEAEQLDEGAHELAAPERDCRPVRFPNCSLWNDRACFRVPEGCGVVRAAPEK